MPGGYECTKCSKTFTSIAALNDHTSTVHRAQGGMPNSPGSSYDPYYSTANRSQGGMPNSPGQGDAAYNAANRSQGGMPNSPGSSYDPYYSTANRSQGGMPNSPGQGDAAYNAANRSQGGMPNSSGSGDGQIYYNPNNRSQGGMPNSPGNGDMSEGARTEYISELNPTGSVKIQKQLVAFFESQQPNTTGGGTGDSGSSSTTGTPAANLTDQEIADFSKKYNGWVAEAAGGNPQNLKNWMNFAGHPLPDDFYEPVNGFIFVQGDGAKDKPDTELKGNGNAVFAVDKDGNMFHVTAAVYQQMVDAGQTPKIHQGSQAVIDIMGVDGVMTSPTVATLYTPTTPAPTPDPVVPPVVVAPTAPAPADPGNGGSTTPAPDNGNNPGSNNGGVALTTYTRNTGDSGFAYPWSAAQSTGTTDIMGTIGKAVTFMNEHEGKNYKYDNVKGTIQAEDGSFISKDDVQALNNIIVTYNKQDYKGVEIPSSVTSNHNNSNPAGVASVQNHTEGLKDVTNAAVRIDTTNNNGLSGVGNVGNMGVDTSSNGGVPLP